MAVHSNTFGGLQLSGEDAKKFRSQVSAGRTSAAAKASAAKGVAAATALLKQGHVKVAKTTA
ncbi:MAG: hypothetical protein JNL35_16840 [Sphingopyxis sp.]|nr:hypothetical protein [Sphingopyxis sp.]